MMSIKDFYIVQNKIIELSDINLLTQFCW